MAGLFCIVTFIIGLFKVDVGYLAVSAGFAIADAICELAASRAVSEE